MQSTLYVRSGWKRLDWHCAERSQAEIGSQAQRGSWSTDFVPHTHDPNSNQGILIPRLGACPPPDPRPSLNMPKKVGSKHMSWETAC